MGKQEKLSRNIRGKYLKTIVMKRIYNKRVEKEESRIVFKCVLENDHEVRQKNMLSLTEH